MKWFENPNVDNYNDFNSVVISSRVRLARNLLNYCFPNRLSYERSELLVNEVRKALRDSNELNNELNMVTIDNVEQVAMMERHIISPQFIHTKLAHSLFITEDESISIMVNEEDHIRIQSLKRGMRLAEAYKSASTIDNELEEKLTYAYSHNLGFLTSCPTNIGTGMRGSYMIHVPALESTGQLRLIFDAIGKFGLTVRGIHGEGSNSEGSVFQISNQVTIGITEDEIIENVTSITKQIVEQELLVRNKILSEKRLELEDAIYRSYGLLTNARVMTAKEGMTLLSDIKLGIDLGLIKTKNNKNINIFNFMTCIQPANLNKKDSKHLNRPNERDILRAEYIRKNLPKLI